MMCNLTCSYLNAPMYYNCNGMWYYSHSASLWTVLHPFYSVAIQRVLHEAIATQSQQILHCWCAPPNQLLNWSVAALLQFKLCFSIVNVEQHIYAAPVVQCYKQQGVQSTAATFGAHPKNQLLNYSVAIVLQLNLLYSVMNVQQYEKCICNQFRRWKSGWSLHWSHDVPTMNQQHLHSSGKRNRAQRRTKVAPRCMLCRCCG